MLRTRRFAGWASVVLIGTGCLQLDDSAYDGHRDGGSRTTGGDGGGSAASSTTGQTTSGSSPSSSMAATGTTTGATSSTTGTTSSTAAGTGSNAGTGGQTGTGAGGATGAGGNATTGTGGGTGMGGSATTGTGGRSGTGGSTGSTGMGGSTGVGGSTGKGGAGGAGTGGSAGTGGKGGAGGGSTAVVCTSKKMWSGDNGPIMHPGETCLGCHRSFQAAGTVYPTLHEPNRCNGFDGIFDGTYDYQVVITDATGKVTSILINSAGNFYAGDPIVAPFRAKVVAHGQERVMQTPQTVRDCNSCHTQDGANGAPGRIMMP